ncbi:hypothetical protein CPB86DRAFT_820671 [Serendipita vermifera]|nr:hypothetical protein CPB86DRAFT_820671 [Serendipita vermifera]
MPLPPPYHQATRGSLLTQARGVPFTNRAFLWNEIMVTFPGDTAEAKVDNFFAQYWDDRHDLLRTELSRHAHLPAQLYYLSPPPAFILLRNWFLSDSQKPLGINRLSDGRLNPYDVDVHFRLTNIFSSGILKHHRATLKATIKADGWPSVPANDGLVEIPFPDALSFSATEVRRHLSTQCYWTADYIRDYVEPYFSPTPKPP